MKTIVVLLALVGMAGFLAGCGGDEPKPPVKPGTTGDAGPATTGAKGDGSGSKKGDAAGSGAAADVIPEMKDFLSTMKGEYEPIDAAREKYTAEGVDTSVMSTVTAHDPQIVKTEKEDDVVSYTFKVKAGISTHTYLIRWKDGKIVELERLELTFD
jgi:hypothetical protein